MPSRLNWTSEEDEFIRYLRNEEKIYSWNEIAQRLTSKINATQRSAKQCRQRYANSAQFCGEPDKNKLWTEEQDKLLRILYLKHGAKWTLFIQDFTHKSQNTIKNRFYSCIRKTARQLRDLEDKYMNSGRKSIKYDMFITLFELANRVEKECENISGEKPDENLNLFKLRKLILQIAFDNLQFSQEELLRLVKSMHKINAHFRCLGIFKIKRKGEWELNKKRLEYILSLKNNIDLDISDLSASESSSQLKASQETSQNRIHQFPSTNISQLDISIQQSFWCDPISVGHVQIDDLDREIYDLLGGPSVPSFFDQFM